MEAGAGKAGAEAVLAVTNDRELRERLHAKGARTVQLQWLISRMDLPVRPPDPWNRRPPSMGAGRAPGSADHDGADDRPGRKPGRGATTKTGPARKVARHKRLRSTRPDRHRRAGSRLEPGRAAPDPDRGGLLGFPA